MFLKFLISYLTSRSINKFSYTEARVIIQSDSVFLLAYTEIESVILEKGFTPSIVKHDKQITEHLKEITITT